MSNYRLFKEDRVTTELVKGIKHSETNKCTNSLRKYKKFIILVTET